MCIRDRPWVIVGHSERRHLFGETDQGIARKVRAAVDHGLRVILCVGETEQERDAGLTVERIVSQVTKGLVDLAPGGVASMIIAYEPVWAIGTGRTGTPALAQEACALCLLYTSPSPRDRTRSRMPSS